MTAAAFRKLALSLPGATEEPHFERVSFRVGKKIFATMTADGTEVMVPVRPIERCYAILESDPAVYRDYGGFTRRHGSLGVRLAKADAKLLRALLREAHERISAKK